MMKCSPISPCFNRDIFIINLVPAERGHKIAVYDPAQTFRNKAFWNPTNEDDRDARSIRDNKKSNQQAKDDGPIYELIKRFL